MFGRSELQELRRRAEEMEACVLNPHWKRAYLNLADALDRVDAMIARTEISEIDWSHGEVPSSNKALPPADSTVKERGF